LGCEQYACVTAHGRGCDPTICTTNPTRELQIGASDVESSSAVAVGPGSDILIAWEERDIGADYLNPVALLAQRFAADGTPSGARMTLAGWTEHVGYALAWISTELRLAWRSDRR
jgi:hypothetical protein